MGTETETETQQASETPSISAPTPAPASAPAAPNTSPPDHPPPAAQQPTPSVEAAVAAASAAAAAAAAVAAAAAAEGVPEEGSNLDPGSMDAQAVSQEAPVRKETPTVNQDAPTTSQNAPTTSQNAPTTSQNAPTSQDGQVITKDPPAPSSQPATLPGGSGGAAPAERIVAGGQAGQVVVVPHPHSFHGPANLAKSNAALPPLTLNHVAIMAASQNKLPLDKVRAVVARMSRHTQSSAGKLGRWYKGDNYVDKDSYSWRNMELFADYQKQMYTASGTVKASCKK